MGLTGRARQFISDSLTQGGAVLSTSAVEFPNPVCTAQNARQGCCTHVPVLKTRPCAFVDPMDRMEADPSTATVLALPSVSDAHCTLPYAASVLTTVTYRS